MSEKSNEIYLKLIGRVQGVFLRETTKQKAHELKIVGTIKNLPDDSVEIIAQGPKIRLQELVVWLDNDPISQAEITIKTLKWREKQNGFHDFCIIW